VQKMANTWPPRALNLSLIPLFYNIARIGGAVGKKDKKDGARRRTKERLQTLTKEPLQRMQKMRPYRPSSSGEREGRAYSGEREGKEREGKGRKQQARPAGAVCR
jgi:hypothetical protein